MTPMLNFNHVHLITIILWQNVPLKRDSVMFHTVSDSTFIFSLVYSYVKSVLIPRFSGSSSGHVLKVQHWTDVAAMFWPQYYEGIISWLNIFWAATQMIHVVKFRVFFFLLFPNQLWWLQQIQAKGFHILDLCFKDDVSWAVFLRSTLVGGLSISISVSCNVLFALDFSSWMLTVAFTDPQCLNVSPHHLRCPCSGLS